MRVRVLTLRYDALLDAFDESPLTALLATVRPIAVRDHAFLVDNQPRLALVVTYADGEDVASNQAAVPAPKQARDRGKDWRSLLGPDDLPLFNTLREWRSTRAKKDGVPPYVICTNRELAALVRARPASLAKIGEVDGFGRGKIERYGTDMLRLLQVAPPRETATPSRQEEPTPSSDGAAGGDDGGRHVPPEDGDDGYG